MNREYRYGDAVRLLGGTDPAIKKLDTLLGLGTLGLWDLVDAKNELIKLGNDLLGRWREWRSGDDWRSRTERIEAAYEILVFTSLFEAVDDLRLPFTGDDLKLAKQAAGKLDSKRRTMLQANVRNVLDGLEVPPGPSPQRPYEDVKVDIVKFYERLANNILRVLQGVAGWDELTAHGMERVTIEIGMALPGLALARYEDGYRRLAGDVPEFALWAQMMEHQATRASLAGLERVLAGMTAGKVLPDELKALRNAQQNALACSVAETGDVPGMRLPTLEEAYLPQRFRAGEIMSGRDNPSMESWWKDKLVREDLPSFITACLTRSAAGRMPLIVLGLPGAGKSVLTRILGARLPTAFFPIRVPLREVSANADIQEQIEEAIYHATGEKLRWPALARSAGNALPVLILDGFDELLQATGVRQSDYLGKVERFQEREAAAGRTVAVIVTSRTAVFHCAKPSISTIVTRLEPFDEDQIGRWLRVWNKTNASYFNKLGVKPFALDLALAHRDLAEQPLLLLMLALYDADDNALGKAAPGLGQAELYEQLMISFVKRELKKGRCPDDELNDRAEMELQRLGFVAFSMLNRRTQWATSMQVSDDLGALRQDLREPSFSTPASPGEQTFGRFFFIYEAKAARDADVVQAYEFLHATFGEFLIARLVKSLLTEMVSMPRRILTESLDDSLLRSLLSWATLSSRTPVVAFLGELAKTGQEADRWHALVRRLFKRLNAQPDVDLPSYRPRIASPAERYAYYSANLLALAVTTAEQVLASELLPGLEDVPTEWKRYFYLWQSQFTDEEWAAQLRVVTSTPKVTSDDLVLRVNQAINGGETVGDLPTGGISPLTMFTRTYIDLTSPGDESV
ncbi:NACHT domain-containing protein [Nonomuraea sp. M3C6]|uniref:NACHT domain-containing protein n=1 Tax=Nonomuraea marmarensis TaxID=3351344 RepID=A0ABW7AB93_9ACTN